MIDPLLLFDVILGLAIVSLAVTVLVVRDRFAMIVLVIVFGLMSALAWVRLAAPDVALAEAAIGTGLTGALLLATWRQVRTEPERWPALPRGVMVINMGLCALVLAGLVGAFLATPLGTPGLGVAVADNLADSGVEHPVTAVLLNFRAYDTLMEVVVLLVAVIAVWMIDRGVSQAPQPTLGPELGDLPRGFARLVLPAITVIGAYLLWVGTSAPGGAFQGGAVLAAVGILLLLTQRYQPQPSHRPLARGVFVLGVAGFAAVALLVAGGGRVPFEYPADHAKTLILLIEGLVTLSIAATLAALFHGREPEAISTQGGRS
ncbi:Na+/H+ antiporter MnhB-like protein [Ectothiorhodospira haloalkaliphila]|uniref:Na+/H+ antiporter MnhB-like protein n=2 Tax=Ectothiorhodospira haloalkaliphila TaxID=421628 RepID=W8KH61_9GAMM|nr:hydrogenase subunit MbhD domain-containing protein [Ectothiorhodospira haloalkaliphila]AHK78508.1 Na+/H+ antiporter MnhB-like protein [Ectothiorhodospira haloalkaliphila]